MDKKNSASTATQDHVDPIVHDPNFALVIANDSLSYLFEAISDSIAIIEADAKKNSYSICHTLLMATDIRQTTTFTYDHHEETQADNEDFEPLA
jgi:hypothetical protein